MNGLINQFPCTTEEYIKKYEKIIYSPRPLGINIKHVIDYAKKKGCEISELSQKEVMSL